MRCAVLNECCNRFSLNCTNNYILNFCICRMWDRDYVKPLLRCHNEHMYLITQIPKAAFGKLTDLSHINHKFHLPFRYVVENLRCNFLISVSVRAHKITYTYTGWPTPGAAVSRAQEFCLYAYHLYVDFLSYWQTNKLITYINEFDKEMNLSTNTTEGQFYNIPPM